MLILKLFFTILFSKLLSIFQDWEQLTVSTTYKSPIVDGLKAGQTFPRIEDWRCRRIGWWVCSINNCIVSQAGGKATAEYDSTPGQKRREQQYQFTMQCSALGCQTYHIHGMQETPLALKTVEPAAPFLNLQNCLQLCCRECPARTQLDMSSLQTERLVSSYFAIKSEWEFQI